ncbi:HNH endonuclease [Polynucleobacter sp. Ross1-W9]|nr:HNH endonuclease [Polynucleobacter parvulilacunae]
MMGANMTTKLMANPQTTKGWGDILDELKRKESIDSDTSLAQSLGVTRGYISLIRVGKKKLSSRLAEDVFRRLGRENESYAIEASIVANKIRSHSNNLSKLRLLVIDRSGGICQLCDSQAPFLDRNGRPYLEIHHVKPLSLGGRHTVENLVALCPNCHQKMWVNPMRADEERLKAINVS